MNGRYVIVRLFVDVSARDLAEGLNLGRAVPEDEVLVGQTRVLKAVDPHDLLRGEGARAYFNGGGYPITSLDEAWVYLGGTIRELEDASV